MRRLRVFVSRVKALFSQRLAAQEFDAEVEAHVDLLAEQYRRKGLSDEDARAAARRQFGAATQLKEELHEQRGVVFLEHILQDARYAFRQLGKSPVFFLTAMLTLALGIGVNTAVFSVLHAVLLRPLPLEDADQLVVVWEQNPHRYWYRNIVSAANFNDWEAQNKVFSDMALIDPLITFNVTGGDSPIEVKAQRVTPNFFSLLGVRPLLGRGFLPEEGRPGSGRVVVLGNALWQR